MRDYQRQRVYNWENKLDCISKTRDEEKKVASLTKEEMAYIVARLNDVYKLDVSIRFRKDGRKSYFYPLDKSISICLSWADNWGVLLHEYAHAIIDDMEYKAARKYPSHGPEFVREFCRLLHYLHPDRPSFKDLATSLRESGVHFKSLSETFAQKRRLSCLKIDLNDIPESVTRQFAPKEVSPEERKRRAAFSKISRIKRKYPLINVENEGYQDDPMYYVCLNNYPNDSYMDEYDEVWKDHGSSYCYDVYDLLSRLEEYVDYIERDESLLAFNDIATEERSRA